MPSSSLIRRAALAFVACFVLGVVLFWKIPTGEFPGALCKLMDDGSVDCSGGTISGDIGGDGGEMPPCELPDDDTGIPSPTPQIDTVDFGVPSFDTTTESPTPKIPTANTDTLNTNTPTAPAESGDGSFFDIFSIFSGQAQPGANGGNGANQPPTGDPTKPRPCYVPPPACQAPKQNQDPKQACKNCKNSCEKCICEKCREPGSEPPKPGDPPPEGCKSNDKCGKACNFADCCDKMPDPQKCRDGRDKEDPEACKNDPKKCSCKEKHEKCMKKADEDKKKCLDGVTKKCVDETCKGKTGAEYDSCMNKCVPDETKKCETNYTNAVKKCADDANKCADNLCKIDGGQNAGGVNVGRPPNGGGGMMPFGGFGGGFQSTGGAGGDLGGSGGSPGGSTGTTGGSGTSGTNGTGTNGTNGDGGVNGTNGTIGGPGPVAPAPGSSSSRSSGGSSSSVSSSSSSSGGPPGSSSSMSSTSTSSQSSSSSSSSSGGSGGSCQNCQFCQGDFCNQQVCDAMGGGPNQFCLFDPETKVCSPNPQRCGSSSSTSSTSSTTSSTGSNRSSSSSSSTPTLSCQNCAYCGLYVTCSRDTCLRLGPCVYNSQTFECTPDPTFCPSSSSSSSRGSSGSSTSSSGSGGSSSSRSSTSSQGFQSSTSSSRSSISSRGSSSSASSPRNGCTGLECILGGGSYCAQTNRTCVLNFDNKPACFDCIARNSSSSSDSSYGFNSSTPYNDIGGTVGGNVGGNVGGTVGGAEGGMQGGEAGTVGGGQGTIGGIGGIEGIPNASFGSSSSRNLMFCGNGIVNSEYGEQCDMGNLNNDVLPDRCRTDCLVPRCGDRVLDSGEQCDDGALNGHLDVTTCDAQCRRSTYDSPSDTVATTIDLPLLPGQFVNPLTGQVESSLTTIATNNPPVGQTGPAALAAMAAGASAGWAWLRRKKAQRAN